MAESEGHEIVIIRRSLEDSDEERHGGVWKIAFADFMTAMMAFFLVMWLIGANEKTRASIARYFNPIRFEETTPNRKGLRDPRDIETKTAGKGEDAGDHPGKSAPQEQKQPEPKQQPESKPPAAATDVNSAPATENGASKIANPPVSQSSVEGPVQQSQTPPARTTAVKKEENGGESFRDPFAPSGPEIAVQSTVSPSPAPRPAVFPSQPSVSAASPTVQSDVADESRPEPISRVQQPIARQAEPAAEQAPVQAEAAKLRDDISSALKDNIAAQPGPGPGIEVRATDEGTLISLMDQAGFEMFAVGSARPQPQVAAMMEKIAQILKAHAGSVIIRGHTDGRVYKSATYDNWRLSADRADMARDMLVNGGLDERRIQRIEGFADRRLKKPDDPTAAENRRIEILVKDDRP